MFNFKDQPLYQELDARIVNGQRWYTTPTGLEYPSVTTVLGATESKDWLNKWKEALGAKKAQTETERCAERGTAVHDMAEHFLRNEDFDTFTSSHKREHIKLFNQLKLRLKRIDNIRALEIPLYSDTLKIAGRVDCIAEYDGTLAIIDFKTSNNNKDTGMIQNYFKQCAAYAVMYEELFGVTINTIVILMAVEKGMMPLLFVERVRDHIPALIDAVDTFHSKFSPPSVDK